MANPQLIKNYVAGLGGILARRIVARLPLPGLGDAVVVPCNGAAGLAFGVSCELAVVEGQRVDVVESGIAEVEYGGAVLPGDLLTSDAQGRAVVPANTVQGPVRIIGVAQVGGALGDIGAVKIAPSQYLESWRNNRVVDGLHASPPTTPSTQGSGAVAADWNINRLAGSAIVKGHLASTPQFVDVPPDFLGTAPIPVLAVGESVVAVVVAAYSPQLSMTALLGIIGTPATTGQEAPPTDAEIRAYLTDAARGYEIDPDYVRVAKHTLNRTGDQTVTQAYDNAWRDV